MPRDIRHIARSKMVLFVGFNGKKGKDATALDAQRRRTEENEQTEKSSGAPDWPRLPPERNRAASGSVLRWSGYLQSHRPLIVD